MNILLKFLFLGCLVLTLSACAQKTLPPWQGEALSVQFSARVVPQASELPVQGGLRMTQDGGTLGLILQQGRTLGQCHFAVQDNNAKAGTDDLPHDLPHDLPGVATGGLHLQCRAAEGVGAAGHSLLQRVALAVYRTLPALTALTDQPTKHGTPPAQKWRVTKASPNVPTTTAASLAATTSPATPMTLQRFVYEDSLGSVVIVFSEIRRP